MTVHDDVMYNFLQELKDDRSMDTAAYQRDSEAAMVRSIEFLCILHCNNGHKILPKNVLLYYTLSCNLIIDG